MAAPGSLLERLVPAKLGRPFRGILAASAATNLGDGLLAAAGPLLVASLTSDPLLISLAAVASTLPWLVVSLAAGIVADRVPRVRLMVVASAARAAVVLGLIALMWTGALTVPLLYACLLLMGTASCFLMTTWGSTVPDLVPHEHLGIANSRLSASQNLMNQLLGPALGGAMFGLAHLLPFGVAAFAILVGAVCIATIRIPERTDDATGSIPVGSAFGRAMGELSKGFRWLWAHAAIRTLAIVIFVFNITFGMTWGVLVVYVRDILRLDATGYGLLMAVSAVGGLLGASVYGWLEARFSYTLMMRVLLTLEAIMHGVLALSTHWLPAAAMLFVFGFYSVVWMTLGQTIRGRAVPSRMRGRVSSVYLLAVFGGVAIGSPIGGAIAQAAGVQATMWWACAGTAACLVLVWRMLPAIGRAGEQGPLA